MGAMKYKTRKRETVEWRYFMDGVYVESRYYTRWVYQREDGSEFINLQFPQKVMRVGGTAYVVRHAWSVR